MPFGIGVTAFSEEDAFALVSERGLDSWFEGAAQVTIRTDVTFCDLEEMVLPGIDNIGPLQLRGVWYPAANIGIGAPKDALYSPFVPSRARFEVWRLDDNDNEFRIRSFETESDARNYSKEMTARGHKQTYWVRRIDA